MNHFKRDLTWKTRFVLSAKNNNVKIYEVDGWVFSVSCPKKSYLATALHFELQQRYFIQNLSRLRLAC